MTEHMTVVFFSIAFPVITFGGNVFANKRALSPLSPPLRILNNLKHFVQQVRKEFLRKTAQWNFRKSFSGSSTNNTMATNKIEPISMDSYDANHKKD